MSCKLFIDTYDTLNDEQKEILHNLYMNGVNHDGHSWVTYGDVEEAAAKLIIAERKKNEGAGGLNYEELKAEATEMYKSSHVWDFAKNDYCPYYCSQCGAKGGAKMKGGAE